MRFDNFRQKDMAEDNTIPEATYRLRVNKVTFKEPKDSEQSGENEFGIPVYRNKKGEDTYPYLTLDLVVQDEGETYGRHVFDNYLSLAPGDDWKIRQIMKALEFDEDEPLDTDTWIDRECYGVVTRQKAGKGKDGNYYQAQNRVGRYMATQNEKA
jgi:hypothetical protein